MPPPIMTTRVIGSAPGQARRPVLQTSLYHFGEGSREGGRAVQALGPGQRDASLRRVLPEQHIDVVQNFHVIADETDGRNHHFAYAFGRVAIQAGFHGWPQPVAAAQPLTLAANWWPAQGPEIGPVACVRRHAAWRILPPPLRPKPSHPDVPIFGNWCQGKMPAREIDRKSTRLN